MQKKKGENMNNIILNFLEVYKSLDELCKQIFSSDIGVSKYIEEMDKELQGSFYVEDWEKDYKKLKHMRWIRNQLVHDTNSFRENIVTIDDIKWLKQFEERIIKCTDPFSLLNQCRNQYNYAGKTYEDLSKVSKKKRNNTALFIVIILLIVVLLISLFVVPIYVSIFKYEQNYSYDMMNMDATDNEVKFETLVFSGEGATTIKNINVPNGNYYIIGKYYGEHNFIAKLHKSVNDNFGHLIANKVGICETIYGLQGPLNNGYINVENASGKWEFSIVACENISKNNLVSEYVYNGSGAKVISNINLPEGEYYITCAYRGNSNFAVTFYNNVSNSFGDLIANEIGKSETTYGIKGPIRQGYIDVNMADGDWTITIEPCQ